MKLSPEKQLELIRSGKICPYCKKATKYVDSKIIYKTRSYGMVYFCKPCDAWVGVHKDTDNALGRLANAELREAKKLAHFYFDKLWNAKILEGFSKSHARGKAYKWLSEQLGIPGHETHIGWMDIELCKKVVDVCKPYAEKIMKKITQKIDKNETVRISAERDTGCEQKN